jgi:hypothetical protein
VRATRHRCAPLCSSTHSTTNACPHALSYDAPAFGAVHEVPGLCSHAVEADVKPPTVTGPLRLHVHGAHRRQVCTSDLPLAAVCAGGEEA